MPPVSGFVHVSYSFLEKGVISQVKNTEKIALIPTPKHRISVASVIIFGQLRLISPLRHLKNMDPDWFHDADG